MRFPQAFLSVLALALASALPTFAQANDAVMQEALKPNTPLEENLRVLTDEVGGRVPGTPPMTKAEQWAVNAFKQAGAEVPTTWEEFAVACDKIQKAGLIAVAHGGTIRAAVGLALGGLVETGLAFDIDNCSVTRLDHFASPGHSNWRLPMVNQQPWIADARHAAMHQPAGPEIVPETKLA